MLIAPWLGWLLAVDWQPGCRVDARRLEPLLALHAWMLGHVLGELGLAAPDVAGVVDHDGGTPVGHHEGVDLVGEIAVLLLPVVRRIQPVDVNHTVIGRVAVVAEAAPLDALLLGDHVLRQFGCHVDLAPEHRSEALGGVLGVLDRLTVADPGTVVVVGLGDDPADHRVTCVHVSSRSLVILPSLSSTSSAQRPRCSLVSAFQPSGMYQPLASALASASIRRSEE